MQVCLAGRAPIVREGVAPEIGDPTYRAAVNEALDDFAFRPGSMRLEPKLASGVATFDGWLAMKSDGRLRFSTADEVRRFIHDGDAEIIVSEYIQTWGTLVALPDGRLVQSNPKGGWWWMTLTYVTEHDIRIVRAVLGLVYAGRLDVNQLRTAILEGPFDKLTYSRLSAVGASLFARMAIVERGEGGRARRSCPQRVALLTFASHQLRPPRNLIAALAVLCCSFRGCVLAHTCHTPTVVAVHVLWLRACAHLAVTLSLYGELLSVCAAITRLCLILRRNHRLWANPLRDCCIDQCVARAATIAAPTALATHATRRAFPLGGVGLGLRCTRHCKDAQRWDLHLCPKSGLLPRHALVVPLLHTCCGTA